MNNLIINQIRKDEINECALLIWDTMLAFNQIKNNKKEKFIESIITSYREGKVEFICAHYQNHIIGVIGFDKNYIKYFFVDKNYQNKKIGTILMNTVKEIINDDITLCSTEYAYKIYMKLGFICNDDGLRDGYEYPMIYRKK